MYQAIAASIVRCASSQPMDCMAYAAAKPGSTSIARSSMGRARVAASLSIRQIVEEHPLSEWRDLLPNDFENHLFREFPLIEAIHQKLYALGASFARMTGSGSAVFGIFDEAVDLSKEFENFTCWSGFLD